MRYRKKFSLKDSIFIREGNYIFFVPVSVLLLFVFISWSWIILLIDPVSKSAEPIIKRQLTEIMEGKSSASKEFVKGGDDEAITGMHDKSIYGSALLNDSTNYYPGHGNSVDDSNGIGQFSMSTYENVTDSSLENGHDTKQAPLQDQDDSVHQNSMPQISQITLSADAIYVFTQYNVSVTATDPDGDELSYAWTAGGGTLDNISSPSIKWSTPENPGSYDITVAVTDSKGANTSKTITVNVLPKQAPEESSPQTPDTQIAEVQTTHPQQETNISDDTYSLKKIVFVSSQKGNKDIFSMNIDGSGLAQLTTGGQDDMYPAISPDGKKIVYSSAIGTTWQIFTMNWDGSGKKQLTNIPSRCGYPSWSYDGRHIFFEIYEDGSWEIYVMASDGSNVKRLTLKPGIDNWHPSAHPFKNVTLYESGRSGGEEIWQIDVNGENNTRISKPGRNYRVPRYSPDASKIAFMGKDKNGKEQVYIMDSNGENIKQLTDTSNEARLPSFSPDNQYIVFNTKSGGSEIFIMNTDGSGKKQLTNFPGVDEVAVFMYHKK